MLADVDPEDKRAIYDELGVNLRITPTDGSSYRRFRVGYTCVSEGRHKPEVTRPLGSLAHRCMSDTMRRTTPPMKRGRVSRGLLRSVVDALGADGSGSVISLLPARWRGFGWWDAPVAQLGRGPSSGQGVVGACRSEGFAAGEHVPDRGGEFAGDLDTGDLGATLFAAATFGAFVVMPVAGMFRGVHRGFDERPAQIARAVLGERTAPVRLAGLIDLGQRPV